MASKAGSVLKNIAGVVGSSLLNFGASMAVMTAITLAAKGIDYLIHYQDKLIEKGEKAKEAISNAFDEFSSKQKSVTDLGKQFASSNDEITKTGDAINVVGKKYASLKQSIGVGNKNLGLSDTDYQSYLDISNQLAEQFPTLVSGYDAQGNAILNLGNNAADATAKLQGLYNAQMLSANVKIGEQLDDNYKGVNAQIKQYQEENKKLQTQKDELDKSIKTYSASSEDILNSDNGVFSIDTKSFGKKEKEFRKKLDNIVKNDIGANGYNNALGEYEFSIEDMSKDSAEKISKLINEYGTSTSNSMAVQSNELTKKIDANKLLIKDQLKSMTESISQYMQTSDIFTGLDNKLQDAFLSNISNLDISTISNDYDGDVKQFLYNEFLSPMENLAPKAQEKLGKLLSLDPKNLRISEYKDLINKTLSDIFPDQTERNNFSKALGLDTLAEDAENNLLTLKKRVSGFNTELLNTLSIDEIKQGLDITANDNFSGTFDEFKKKIDDARALAETAIDIKANPKFDAIAEADETANAGDDYVKSIQYAKDAKEMYDKGLIGTDDFKTRAAYFSPTGADDDVNFAENYPKISRYMTEDATGVQNFLNDLKSKGLATFETLSDGTKKWSYDIKDLEESATSMGMGFEWFIDMFGRLEDYGFHNNFVGSVEEGAEKISDLTTQLSDAEIELARLKATGADDTAISQQEAKVAQLRSDLEQTQNATNQLQEHAAEQYAKQVQAAKTQIESLNEQRKAINDEDYGGNGKAVKKKLEEEIKQLAEENNIELDANLNVVNESQVVQDLEGKRITIPVEYEKVNYDNIDGVKEQAKKVLKDNDGKLVTNNAILSINLDTSNVKDVDTQLQSVTDALEYVRKNSDGVLNFDSTEVKNAIQVMNALYAQKRKLADEKFDSMDLSGMDESLSSALGKLHEFQKIKIELDRQRNLQKVGIQIDTTETEASYNKLVEELQGLDPEIKAKLGLDTSSEESINDWLENYNPQITAQLNIDKTKAENELRGIAYSDENEIIMKVNADTSQIENAISSLQNGQSATFNASVTDSKGNSHDSTLVTGTKDEKGVIHYYAEFEDEGKVELEKNQDGKLVYKADVKDVEDKVNELESENPKVKVELTPEEQKVQDALKSLLNDQTKTTFSVDADFSKVKDDINALEVGHSIVFTANVDGVDQAVAAVKYQDGSIGYIANVDGVYYQLSAVQNTDGTVSYTIGNYPTEVPNANQTIDRTPNNSQILKSPSSVGQTVNRTPNNSGILQAPPIFQKVIRFFTGGDKLLGTAHASGTLSNSSNLKDSWKTKKDEVALTGEVGEELVVSGNRWFTTGSNGAEFANISAGSVVFNSKQTKELLSQGFTKSRGKGNPSLPGLPAFLEGSAFAGGSGGGGFRGGASKSSSSKKKSSSSSSKSSSNNSSNSSSKSNSSSNSSNDKEETKETLDWIETKLDRIKRKIDELDTTASSTYRTWSKRNEALSSELSKVTEKISLQQQAYDRYIKEAESAGEGLSSDWIDKIQNGKIDIETITDSDLKEKISDYKNWYEKALDCRDAIIDLKEQESKLIEQRFNNIKDEYDAILKQFEHTQSMLESAIDITETSGYIVSTKYYDSLISNENEKINKLYAEREALVNSLNSALSSGKIDKYSESWYNMQNEIDSIDESIQDCNKSTIEWGNSIRQIQWDLFDKLQDRISKINDEADFLKELMSSEKMYDDKNGGQITEYGKATFGLHGVKHNTLMTQADEYRKEMEKIDEQLKSDPFNQTLIDRRSELLKLQQESISSAKQEKDAIKDLVEDGINSQLDALQKLIDKYTDLLDTNKDMYDYQKQLAEKQKEISSIEKQLAAYQGDTSEEGASKRQQLQNDLNDVKQDLAETQYERSIADQKKLLDDLYEQYEEVLNMRLDNIDVLVSDVIANVNSEAGAIRDTLEAKADSVGYTMTESMNTIWNSANQVITNYGTNFLSSITGVQNAINDLTNLIKQAVDASNKKASASSSSTKPSSSTSTPKPATPTPTPKPATTSSGDGVPNVGDAVTFNSGAYYYSSDGISPTGTQMHGQTVYITKINNASWAKKKYHISKDKNAAHPLGWVDLSQISGYEKGIKSVPRDEMAIVGEHKKPETIVLDDGSILTPLSKNSSVFNNDAHENLWSFANDPQRFIDSMIQNPPEVPNMFNEFATNQTNTVTINIPIENVSDYNDFVRQLQKDSKFEKMVQTMVLEPIAGNSTIGKYKQRF